MRAVWKKIRYRFEWLALKGATKIVPLLSRNACYRVALFIGALAATLDRAGRRVAMANLQVAFGSDLSPTRRAEIVRESYQHFTRTMLDLFWSPRFTRENFSQYVEIENLEAWKEEAETGRPVIVGCYHYSNFEWLAISLGHRDLPAAILAQEFKNPLLDPIFVDLRESCGHRMVAREGAILQLYKVLRRGGKVAILIDLTIPARIPSVAVDCFGLKRNVTFAHAWLHQRTGAPLVTAHCEPLPGGRYRVVFHPKIELPSGATVYQIAQACWDQFEPVVRKNPAPWLWMYKHWRYRPSSADPATYPFYANLSPEFERRLDESANNLEPMSSPPTIGTVS